MQKLYTKKEFNLPELTGLSQRQIEAHLGLYAGYIKNVNILIEQIETLRGKGGPELSELSRRIGFEFNGMRLHEYYFEQFEDGGEKKTILRDALAAQFGSFDAWKEDFVRIGSLRGAGWVLLVQDEENGNFFNIWVNDHELGHLGSQKIWLAMDVWEHAFLLDYLPSERKKYIEAFFDNVNWNIVEGRV